MPYDTPRKIKGEKHRYLRKQVERVADGDIDPNTFLESMFELGLDWEDACMELAGAKRYKEFLLHCFE